MSIFEQIKEWELQLVDPETRKNSELVGALLSDQFEEIGSSGRVYRRNDILANLEIDPGTRYVLSNFKFTDLAAGCILVKYVSEVSGMHAHRSSIWSDSSGTWQMLHHQSTVIPNAT